MLARTARTYLHDIYSDANSPVQGNKLTWHGIPVIHDEVFTGLYRLGHFSSSSLIRTEPDISVYAKLLTGGLLPLCTTLASESIFDAFLSPEKSDALLHGHSYTAHAVGCDVARHSLQEMKHLATRGAWRGYQDDWTVPATAAADAATVIAAPTNISSSSSSKTEVHRPLPLWSMWSASFVHDLSFHGKVDGIFALGSVLAVSLRDPSGAAGYTSTAATGLRDALLRASSDGGALHSRVLGNVLYLMASMTTRPEALRRVERMVREAIDY